jgi:hypothetical protein
MVPVRIVNLVGFFPPIVNCTCAKRSSKSFLWILTPNAIPTEHALTAFPETCWYLP